MAREQAPTHDAAGARRCRRRRQVALAGCVLAAALLLPAAAAGAATPQLVEQKLRLLEGYFRSETAGRIQGSGNDDALAALSQAQGLVVDARDALSDGDTTRAAALADQALRAFSSASRLASRSAARPSAAQRTRYAGLRDTMRAFRATLDDARPAGGAVAPAGIDLAALDAEMARAGRLAAEGYLERANALLAELYTGTMRAISESRASETVVYRLEFETPHDELAYERERFRGNELLIDMLVEKGASDGARRLADRFAEQARAKRDAALAMAEQGEVAAAIAAMEEAGALLGKALRTLGLPYAP